VQIHSLFTKLVKSHLYRTDKKGNKYFPHILGAKSYTTNDLLIFGENICAFSHIFIFVEQSLENLLDPHYSQQRIISGPGYQASLSHWHGYRGQRWALKNRRRMPLLLKESCWKGFSADST
jgi:hypothetical protein